ncbi:MAG: methyltransferase domain-containing protein, partial [Nitrospira defluvii]|nr:methyltransferase domain-containing protein [Nitrospira defluvii]
HEIRATLHDHLTWWGLRHVESDAAYFAWQREVFTPQELATLHQHIEAKRLATDGPSAEIAFYDLTAQPRSVSALYSQRYEYYLQVGSRVARHLDGAPSVLDVGCGIGILTTFYAQQHPNGAVLGIDRSPASIDLARQRAQELGLSNLRFECLDVDRQALTDECDLVIATHTLLQAEQDPGLPSRDWRTFERSTDMQAQQRFEQRTGLGVRLDRLRAGLTTQGRMLVFEKTRQLARRVPFQRALAARGLQLLAPPEPVRYRSVEEVTDDGPLYLLGSVPQQETLAWNESPEPDEASALDLEALRSIRAQDDQPLYENHESSAQQAWMTLTDKQVLEQVTNEEPDGRQLHVEWGRAGDFMYLYCANTFDQRQLVLIEPARAALLETYYREITRDIQSSAKGRSR